MERELPDIEEPMPLEQGERVVTARKPFATEPTEQGLQYVIPGCEHDQSRGPEQMDLLK